IGIGGAVGVLAALTRSGNGIVDAVPSALAAVIAILVLGALIRMLRDTEPTRVAPSGRVSRRRFVGTTAATAAGGALALVIGQAVANGFRT
ncbi:twin-arginine translocation signal domain-containing protein, partial [Pseudomonas sp. SIMBA_064]